MMRRYITGRKPRVDYFEDPHEHPVLPYLTVFERDPSPVDTGLIDKAGNPILAVDEMDPIGFVRFEGSGA